MCWTQKFSFSRDPVILDLKLQLALIKLFDFFCKKKKKKLDDWSLRICIGKKYHSQSTNQVPVYKVIKA
jgi:hypothetical protein